jgi:hypothetical protein
MGLLLNNTKKPFRSGNRRRSDKSTMYEILAFGNDEDCQNSRTNDNWSHVRKQ